MHTAERRNTAKRYTKHTSQPSVYGLVSSSRSCLAAASSSASSRAWSGVMRASDQAFACAAPVRMRTRIMTGSGSASIAVRNRNPRRMLPVLSEIRPTTIGPMNDADLSVREKSEKNDDSCPGGTSSAYTARAYELNGP